MISNKEFQEALYHIVPEIVLQGQQPREFTLSVKKKFHNSTLLNLYTQSFPHRNTVYWANKIESGNLRLDHRISNPDQRIKAGQITRHTVAPKEEPTVNWDISLLYATTRYWVINKPSPLPVHAGGRFLHHTLINGLKIAFPEKNFHLIHRLDANTTGILLIALDKTTAHILGKQFSLRQVNKTYLALVMGRPKTPIFESSRSVGKDTISAGGRELVEGSDSITHFKIIESFNDFTLLKVTPHSGHTNQIRLHLSDLQLPIVGDIGYRDPDYFKHNPLTYGTDCLFYMHGN